MPSDDLLAAIEDNPAVERIAAALDLLRQVPNEGGYGCDDTCWREHADCLARRTIAILTEETDRV